MGSLHQAPAPFHVVQCSTVLDSLVIEHYDVRRINLVRYLRCDVMCCSAVLLKSCSLSRPSVLALLILPSAFCVPSSSSHATVPLGAVNRGLVDICL